MLRSKSLIDKTTELAVFELLKSRAEARIYIFLLKKNGALSEEIIKGTKLHPSTVRELLSKMYNKKMITRTKIKNDSIGKNPYFYQPIPPRRLLQRRIKELEQRLNKIYRIDRCAEKSAYVQIQIITNKVE
ncbi:MAG: helix-turn-helix domain-containing protein [Candidatus Thermoplasmatota archaeon]